MIPILDQVDNAGRFSSFLTNENEIIEATFCRYDKDHWEIDKKSAQLLWPKKGVMYPEVLPRNKS